MSATPRLVGGLSALLLIGALGAAPAAATGATIVVAADGSGEATSISEALAAAAAGDIVLVTPGVYAEAIVIDSAITLQGEGSRESIVLKAPETALVDPAGAVQPTLLLRDSDATIAGLTILGTRRQGGVQVQGGAPVLEGNAIGAGVHVSGPAEPMIRGNEFQDFADVVVAAGASALVEGNDFSGGSIRIDGGRDVRVSGNTISTSVSIVGEPGIDVRGAGGSATLEGNTVSGSGIGIAVADGATAVISGNELRDTGIGIAWFAWQSGTVAGNSVCGEGVPIWVAEGTGLTVDDVACTDEPAG